MIAIDLATNNKHITNCRASGFPSQVALAMSGNK